MKSKTFEEMLSVGSTRIVKSVNFSVDEIDLLKTVLELARREGLNFSAFVKKALAEYIEKHYPGNPQLPLKKFLEAPVIANRCEVAGCKRKAVYRVLLQSFSGNRKWFRVCRSHRKSKIGDYKFLKAFKRLGEIGG